jgi:hypothetical protein
MRRMCTASVSEHALECGVRLRHVLAVARASLLSGTLSLLAGCGNYSNEDLAYMAAIPAANDLHTDVPMSALSIVTPPLYQLTRDISGMLDGGTDQMLGLLDTLRTVSPTSRKGTKRYWGPVPDQSRPGWMWQVTIDRPNETTFTYQLGYLPSGASADQASFVEFLNGSFAPGGTIRRGTGELHAHTDLMRSQGVPLRGEGAKDRGFEDVSTFDVAYQTGSYPWSTHTVIVGSASASAPNATTQYDATQSSDGSHTMAFVSPTMDDPSNILSIESRWLPSGAGRSRADVTGGPNAGGNWTECWNQSFEMTFENRSWLLSSTGDVNACIP